MHGDRPGRGSREGPLCFMHVPKCAGTSVRRALEDALGPDALAPRRMDADNFSRFRAFDRLPAEQRARVAADDAEMLEMASYPVTSGHFGLRSLRLVAPPERIAVVLREPRARVLSLYLHLRLQPALRTLWGPYAIHRHGEGPPVAFLREPAIAASVDNRICRALLQGDRRVADGVVVRERDLEAVAEAAWERLTQLGCVTVLEQPDAMWQELGAHFGVPLRPVRENVGGEAGVWPGMLPVPRLGGEATIELLERRTRADAIVYARAVAQRCGDAGARELTETAFADQLTRYARLAEAAG